MKNILLILVSVLITANGFGQKETFPPFFKEKEILIFKTINPSEEDFKNLIIENNIMANLNTDSGFTKAYAAVLKEDSIQLTIRQISFERIIEAYEFMCGFFSIADDKIYELGWMSLSINDSLFVTWYSKNVYIIGCKQSDNRRIERVMRKAMLSTNKLKNLPNFLQVFPSEDVIQNSCRASTLPFLQQDHFIQTYYADYESKGNISRIFIIPVEKDSIFIQFQKFRDFWKTRGLLVELDTPVELPHFVAQDVFLGRMICVIYQDYIIGIMNYHSLERAKEYLDRIRKNLKEYPVLPEHTIQSQ